MVKMKDVADRAGVSVATVSNVITGKRTVSPEAQKNVLKAIKELDYHVNTVARGLKTQRTNTIGVVLPDIAKLFFGDVLHGIMAAASKNRYNITILSSNYDFETEKQQIDALRGNHVDAIILDSCVSLANAAAWGRELAENVPIPIVSLEDQLDKDRISSICVDCCFWSGKMTQHLIDQGRRDILYISGPSELVHENNRLQGYLQTLERNGIPVRDELIARSDFLSHSGYSTVKQVLRKGIHFDAIQSTNDQAAVGAIKALKESGISIPDQVAVTGFDNLFPSTLITPSLTTLDVPRYYMGYEAVSESIRRAENADSSAHHIVLNCQVIPRSSTMPVSDSPWNLENW